VPPPPILPPLLLGELNEGEELLDGADIFPPLDGDDMLPPLDGADILPPLEGVDMLPPLDGVVDLLLFMVLPPLL
jgi:hypothetical protein